VSSDIQNAKDHLITITKHRHEVMRLCFKVGLYKQGLLHDLSKYTPIEFLSGVRYYQGTRSPNDVERRCEGYSSAWMHHKGRNRHHYEYWTDYKVGAKPGTIAPVKMPRKYVAEMFCDRIAACKIYNKENYNVRQPMEYLERAGGNLMMDPETYEEIDHMLRLLARYGEKAACRYVKEVYLNHTISK